MSEPFVKWVGGKRQLVKELLKYVPGQGYNYYEPFCGGAALFFALRDEGRFHTWHLNDSNPDLINVYKQVRDDVERLINVLGAWDRMVELQGFQRTYDLCRNDFNAGPSEIVKSGVSLAAHFRAARFIALNSWGFNGLCRYNKSGKFNVPCGKFKKVPVLMDKADKLRAASLVLKGVEITCGDFAVAVEGASEGDFVYFDPPYIPASVTSNFTGYTADGFGGAEQAKLRDLALTLVDRGVHVVLSNSDTPATRSLYTVLAGAFKLCEVQARRAVNCDAKKRGKVGELIIVGAR